MAEEIVGNRVKAKIVKNKVAAPFRTAEFDIMYNEGISLTGDLIDLGSNLGLIKKTGTTFFYKDIKLGAGRETAKKMLKEKPVKVVKTAKKPKNKKPKTNRKNKKAKKR